MHLLSTTSKDYVMGNVLKISLLRCPFCTLFERAILGQREQQLVQNSDGNPVSVKKIRRIYGAWSLLETKKNLPLYANLTRYDPMCNHTHCTNVQKNRTMLIPYVTQAISYSSGVFSLFFLWRRFGCLVGGSPFFLLLKNDLCILLYPCWCNTVAVSHQRRRRRRGGDGSTTSLPPPKKKKKLKLWPFAACIPCFTFFCSAKPEYYNFSTCRTLFQM